MAPPFEIDEDIELLELEAAAREKELAMQQDASRGSGATGSWDEPTGFWEGVGDKFTLENVVSLPVKAAQGIASIPSLVGSAGEWAAHMVSGVDETGAPFDRQAGAVKALENTRDIALSPIPGGRALGAYLTDADIGPFEGVNPDRPSAEYGRMVGEDLTALPWMAGAAAYSGVKNRQARRAAEIDAFDDPTSQAALRYAENRGLLNTPSAKTAIAQKRVTPEVESAAATAQGEARGLYQDVPEAYPGAGQARDYLPGNALGYPESSSSGRPFAASEEMGKAGPVLIQSRVYTGGDRINPFTGVFEGPSRPVKNSTELYYKMQQASVDILQARKATVSALDQAMQVINKQSPGDPKIRGIVFDFDVAPLVDDLREVIQKRAMLSQTGPMSDSMLQAYRKIEESFGAIQNSSQMMRYLQPGPAGSFAKGELLPSQALSMIENMNAFRRAVGEFDELGRAAGLNSTFSDYTGRAAELYSMSKVQAATQAALDTKAAEILGLAPTVRGFHSWQDLLANVKGNSLGLMNDRYEAFQTAKEAALTYNNTTRRGMVTPEPGRLITTAKEGQQIQATDIMNPKLGAVRRFANKIWGADPPNPMLDAATKNLQRPEAAVTQVIDGLLLREKAAPILSRSWKDIKADPNSLTELGNRAVMFGLLPAGFFEQMSEPQQKQVHAMVIQAYPQGATSTPGGLNIINGEYADPTERDSVVREASSLPAHERARIIGPSFENKHVPFVGTEPQATPTPMAMPDLSSLNNSLALPDIEMDLGVDYSYSGESSSMIDQMEEATRVHAYYETLQ